MKVSVTKGMFRDEMNSVRPDNFSYEGLGELFDFLEEAEDNGSGEDHELDVIGICCDFAEAEISEVLSDYNLEDIEELEESTIVLSIDGTDRVIYAQF